MLKNAAYEVSVFVVSGAGKGTADFVKNLERLVEMEFAEIQFIEKPEDIPLVDSSAIIIDALLGTGLAKPVEGLLAELIETMNSSGAKIISIDIPSGLPADLESDLINENQSIVRAYLTLSFQQPKLSFFFISSSKYTGKWKCLDIGLDRGYYDETESDFYFLNESFIRSLLKKRDRFAHKGNFGHALLIAGSFGKMGAALMATEACIRSGAGLVTAYIPKAGYSIMQTAVPEAMVMADESPLEISLLDFETEIFDGIGIGPGVGMHPVTRRAVSRFISNSKVPLVIDADALNICSLSLSEESPFSFPVSSILTPHPGEFDRLAGASENEYQRFIKARNFATHHNIYLLLKGAHTVVCTPEGKCYFNSTGNPGMATGGSGDVLTGIITALLAQGYPPAHAAVIGAYMHGFAGDLAAAHHSQESMKATDIIDFLGNFFLSHNAQQAESL
jgi:ADP-dependent NAD(P)H-hydrate dehydratase / NAD(P)H-hydrate epimerase